MRLQELNTLPPEQAQTELSKCCGSSRWAQMMAAARPFADAQEVFTKADEIWWSLNEEDWLEAFRAHPKIGEKKASTGQSEQAQKWSAQEQSRAQSAAATVMDSLTHGNRAYQTRFGFIFIICATGKTADEMLAILNQRLSNPREVELRNAAEEQRKITQLRLAKLLQP